MTEERNDRYHDSEHVGPEFDGVDAVLDEIHEKSERAALDDSGYWFHLLGKDVDGRGHYLKDGSEYSEIVVMYPDQEIIATREFVYEGEANLGRLESYVWEHEWQELTEYGAT